MRYKIGDKVRWKYGHYGDASHMKGCVIIDTLSTNFDRYKVKDYDNFNIVGGCVETWVHVMTFELNTSEHRDMKLKELGI